jgi:peptidoglycan/LPS O-acetylase OafA/YrhL
MEARNDPRNACADPVTVLDHHPGSGSAPRTSRLLELDGLRGLACVAVVLGHVSLFLQDEPGTQRFPRSLTHVLWDGNAAVLLFFVLSGFVLALPYVEDPQLPLAYVRFVLRRFFRIYPAYWAALLLSLALRRFVFEGPGLTVYSFWARSFWHDPLSNAQLWSHVAMVLPRLQHRLIDPVIWSLVLEMKLSLVFPAVLELRRRARARPLWALFAVSALTTLTLLGWVHASHPLKLLPLFVFGALLAEWRSKLTRSWNAMGRFGRGAVRVAALLLYGTRHVWPGVVQYEALDVYLTTVGCGLVVVLALNSRLLSVLLRARVIQWLGARSYSLYLVHLPLMLAIASRLRPALGSQLGTLLVAVAASTAAAWALSVGVEQPGQALGRALIAGVGSASTRPL